MIKPIINFFTIYGDTGQAAATRESKVSYACHVVANRNRGKTATVSESPVSDVRHAIGNRDGGNGHTKEHRLRNG